MRLRHETFNVYDKDEAIRRKIDAVMRRDNHNSRSATIAKVFEKELIDKVLDDKMVKEINKSIEIHNKLYDLTNRKHRTWISANEIRRFYKMVNEPTIATENLWAIWKDMREIINLTGINKGLIKEMNVIKRRDIPHLRKLVLRKTSENEYHHIHLLSSIKHIKAEKYDKGQKQKIKKPVKGMVQRTQHKV